MSDSWDDMRRTKEEEYFARLNAEALQRLQQRTDHRSSPVTGKPMVQKTVMGVVVDECPTTGGVWLDKGELEQIVEAARKAEGQFTIESFIAKLFHFPKT